jgi:hypothetical protein
VPEETIYDAEFRTLVVQLTVSEELARDTDEATLQQMLGRDAARAVKTKLAEIT